MATTVPDWQAAVRARAVDLADRSSQATVEAGAASHHEAVARQRAHDADRRGDAAAAESSAAEADEFHADAVRFAVSARQFAAEADRVVSAAEARVDAPTVALVDARHAVTSAIESAAAAERASAEQFVPGDAHDLRFGAGAADAPAVGDGHEYVDDDGDENAAAADQAAADVFDPDHAMGPEDRMVTVAALDHEVAEPMTSPTEDHEWLGDSVGDVDFGSRETWDVDG